MHNRIALKEY